MVKFNTPRILKDHQVNAVKFIEKLMESTELNTQQAVGDYLGISQQAIAKFLKAGIMGRPSVRKLIENSADAKVFIFGVTPEVDQLARNNAKSLIVGNQMAIPLISERAHAGYASMWSDKEYLEDLPVVYMDHRQDGIYRAFEVVGDSLECEFDYSIREGDIIIAKELQKHHWANRLHLPDIFVIVLREDGILIKEVTKHDTERGVITCHSQNSYYSDFEVDLSNVVKLYYLFEHRKRRLGRRLR